MPQTPSDRAKNSLLERAAQRWRLELGEPLEAYVVACRGPRGEDLVLKLGGRDEAAALAAWGGRRAVRLVDFAREDGALLLRRVRPGTAGPPDVALVADVLGALHAVAPPRGLPTLAERLGAYFAQRELDVPAAASALVGGDVLLHGDLMPENLLWDGSGLVAIDPLPMVGDPCADIGFWAATTAPDAARELARACGRDPERAAVWAAVWALGEARTGPPDHARMLRAWLAGDEARRLLG